MPASPGARGARPALSLLLLWLAVIAPARGAGAASFPPHYRFRSLVTPRVSVHFHQGLEVMARDVAALSAEILAAHEARYGTRVGRVQLVLADADDFPNGFASPLPYPLVQLRAIAPNGADEFGNYESWLRLVLTHELAHIVHLEQGRGVVGAGRKLFGRAPFLFPNALAATWTIEGLATYEETQNTAFGRGRNPDSRMVLRMAALEGDFPHEDQPMPGLDRWPAGQSAYLFGEAFLRDLTQRQGPETLPRLARHHSGHIIPYLDELTARSVTGASLHWQWENWRKSAAAAFAEEAERIRGRGLTVSQPLTTRGVRQEGPRYSPDGEWIAYTSRTLTRHREIRLMRADGSQDRGLGWRDGGSRLAWTPDGRSLVFDEPEIHRGFETRFDLRLLDVATRRERRLTRGIRARDPDVSPDGRTVYFVREDADRGELAAIDLAGGAPRALTRSSPGVRWSAPRVSPDGTALVAARWSEAGHVDLVLLDLVWGTLFPLTEDRARDADPAWTRDGRYVLFRSDRDGVSNLYALRLADGAIQRVSNVLGGAFQPDVSPRQDRLAFAGYSSAGYDVRVMDLALGQLAPAPAFADPYPAAHAPVAPAAEPERPYRPLRTILPRFWTPYLTLGDDETRFGAATGGTDPLLRHAWGADVRWGTETEKVGAQAFYQYDRFRPTFVVVARNTYEPEAGGEQRTREVSLRASLPVARSLRSSQSVSLAWRRRREDLVTSRSRERLDLGGIEAAWSLSSVQQYPYSISPLDGVRLRAAVGWEDPAFGSQIVLAKPLADARGYLRLFGESDTLALRIGGGTSYGRPGFTRSYAVGGFPDGSLFDVVLTNHSVLRGYPDRAFSGRNFVHANAEYRFPLAHPQRGAFTLPVFLRHLHAAVFADAADAWSGSLGSAKLKTSAGVAVGADLNVFHAIPLTGVVGVARGFSARGETQVYVRTGLSF